MGTRTVFQVFDNERQLVASLYANSSHARQFADEVFAAAVQDPSTAGGPNGLVERLLSARYDSDEGAHRAGDRIFWMVPHAMAGDGDIEAVVAAIHRGAHEELVTKGYAAPERRAWTVERRDV